MLCYLIYIKQTSYISNWCWHERPSCLVTVWMAALLPSGFAVPSVATPLWPHLCGHFILPLFYLSWIGLAYFYRALSIVLYALESFVTQFGCFFVRWAWLLVNSTGSGCKSLQVQGMQIHNKKMCAVVDGNTILVLITMQSNRNRHTSFNCHFIQNTKHHKQNSRPSKYSLFTPFFFLSLNVIY